MKLGVFDSGLGGLVITRAIRNAMADIDIVYLGDTLNVPYGSRSTDVIYDYSKAAMEHLFGTQDCGLVIVACNTASAAALRRLQQEWLPQHYPKRRILGVVVPALEEAIEQGGKTIGLIGTNYIVGSNIYGEELRKLDSGIELHQVNTPLLVALIEHDGWDYIGAVLDDYLAPLMEQGIESLILGCTHYPALKDIIRAKYDVPLISQDDIIPGKLKDYLDRHPEIDETLDRHGKTDFIVSELTQSYLESAKTIYGEAIAPKKVVL